MNYKEAPILGASVLKKENFMKIYKEIAGLFQSYHYSSTREIQLRCEEEIEEIVKEYMPSGSGIDNGTSFDFDKSKLNKLIFTFDYHHMNEHGYYDGWTSHKAYVTPDLNSETLIKISGRDRNMIKDYLWEVYNHALNQLKK